MPKPLRLISLSTGSEYGQSTDIGKFLNSRWRVPNVFKWTYLRRPLTYSKDGADAESMTSDQKLKRMRDNPHLKASSCDTTHFHSMLYALRTQNVNVQ